LFRLNDYELLTRNNASHCLNSDSSMAEAIFLDTSGMEASLRKMSEARGKQAGVSSKAGWCKEREGGQSIQFVVAISRQRGCWAFRKYEHQLSL